MRLARLVCLRGLMRLARPDASQARACWCLAGSLGGALAALDHGALSKLVGLSVNVAAGVWRNGRNEFGAKCALSIEENVRNFLCRQKGL